MYCQHCGQQVAEGQKFCANCGAPIGQPAPAAAPPPASLPVVQPAPRRGASPVLRALLLIVVAVVILVAFPQVWQYIRALFGAAPTGKATYVKDVVGYEEGDAVIVYFVLGDDAGKEIATAGNVDVTIYDGDSKLNEDRLYHKRMFVDVGQFEIATVGQGQFQRQRVICNLGRIPYTAFSRNPAESTGTVELTFVPQGQASEFAGETIVVWLNHP